MRDAATLHITPRTKGVARRSFLTNDVYNLYMKETGTLFRDKIICFFVVEGCVMRTHHRSTQLFDYFYVYFFYIYFYFVIIYDVKLSD